jgi:SPP1 family predicted phage head-tail adaptor
MQAGKLDRRVTFERATATQASPSGEQVLTWAEERSVWAQVEPLSGVELFRSQQLGAKVDTRFRIRWPGADAGITPDETLRILYEGRYYDIRSVLELGRREGLEIMAEARAD